MGGFDNLNVLKKMMIDQQTYNRLLFDKTKASDRSKSERLRELTLGLVEESLEFIRTFDYKVHRRSKLRLQNIAHSHEELVDAFKYWLSLADLVDFPLDRLEELYYAKSRVVQYRYQEEWLKKIDGPCVVIDIDQVLGDYISGICDWAKEYGTVLMKLAPSQIRRVVDRLDELKATGGWVCAESVGVSHLQWQQVKHHFRTNGGKRLLPVFADARPFLDWCKIQGWKIVLITSRPIDQYPNIFTDTLTWLADNNLPYDFVWWATEKGERLAEEASLGMQTQIVFAVDDSLTYVNQFRAKGITTFQLNRSLPPNYEDGLEDGMLVRSLSDLMKRWTRLAHTSVAL